MIILAIETSCDDTAVALIKASGKKLPKFEVLSNIVSSQVKIHAKYGGVYPTLAKREHQKNLPLVLQRTLKEAQFASRPSKIDLIAVTMGPGLEPCLWVGVNFAKELAKKLKKPVVPVNHIEAHIFANWLPSVSKNSKNIFPAISLIVSGGHTQLILIKKIGSYKILGETRDDAAGECFDKVARVLGLGYPGGPAIEAEAAKLKKDQLNKKLTVVNFLLNLPRPMLYQKNYDFSFSGLKTAVLYHYKSQAPKTRKSKEYIQAVSAEAQQAIIDVLIHKTIKATKEHKVKTIILGGGVTANTELRKQFQEEAKKLKFNLLVPPKKFSTDNAAMIAVTAYYCWLRKETKSQEEIKANANLRLE